MNTESTVRDWETQFDAEFTREDGLIDKYSYYGCVEEDLGPNTTPEAIKMFIKALLVAQHQSDIQAIREYLESKEDTRTHLNDEIWNAKNQGKNEMIADLLSNPLLTNE